MDIGWLQNKACLGMQAAERDWLVSRMSRSEWRQKQEQDRGRPSVLHREFGLDSEDEEKL